jgi:hypothetical protein
VSGHKIFSDYLDLLFLPGAGELSVFCGAMVGASMGFLWWNCYPAQIFMGDVGSLSLGGALGTLAILIKQELLLFVVGGLFVVEAFSVMLQVASFASTGKRIFPDGAAPPPLELIGWKEPRAIHHPLLDRRFIFAVRAHDAEASVKRRGMKAPWMWRGNASWWLVRALGALQRRAFSRAGRTWSPPTGNRRTSSRRRP